MVLSSAGQPDVGPAIEVSSTAEALNAVDRRDKESRMRPIRRRPLLLPLQLPRLDGTSWPDRRKVGRDSFAASTLYQLGYREAFSPEAHHITDLLLDQVLPLIRTDATPEDEPYQRGVFSAAAQIGAGIGMLERRVVPHPEPGTDRQVARALGGRGRPPLHARAPARRRPLSAAVWLLPRAHRAQPDPAAGGGALRGGPPGRRARALSGLGCARTCSSASGPVATH